MTPQMRISVVIPCYNAAGFLPETLASVLRQTYPPYEVLVVDDGSSDDSASAGASFGPPVRVIRQANQGESVARNRGIDEARGDWVAFLDADDQWDPAKLQRQVACLDGQCLAVCSGVNILDVESDRIVDVWTPTQEAFTMEEIISRGSSPCHISTLLVRADVPVRFPTWTRYGEDAVYLIELAQLGPVQIIPAPLATYRRHAKSQSKSLRDIEVRYHDTFERWIVDYSNIEELQERTRLRTQALGVLIRWHQLAHWQRDWDRFDVIHQYLASFQDRPGVEQALLLTRRYPRWCYRVKNFLYHAIGNRESATHDAPSIEDMHGQTFA
jgi:glycosyltransferase involved in cell wall biosynthesis